MSLNLIMLGPPGAGKGTQGALLSKSLSLPKFATGDLLRDAVKHGTPLGLTTRYTVSCCISAPLVVVADISEGITCTAQGLHDCIALAAALREAQADENLRRLAGLVTVVEFRDAAQSECLAKAQEAAGLLRDHD